MPDRLVLHHDTVSEPSNGPDSDRRIVVLHGIYGAGRNWNSVARRAVRERPGWAAEMVDLRGHGESPAGEPPHTVEAAAGDLARTAREDGFEPAVVLGHSFGGKVALEYLRLAAGGDAPVPEQLWLVDSTPATREPGGEAWEMLERLRRHPGPFRSRDEGIDALADDGLSRPVARWMGTNLIEGGDGAWRWRLDVDVMEALLRDFFDRDAWEVLESLPTGGEASAVEIHLIRATDSPVLDGEALRRMRRAAERSDRVHLHEVEGGHWLNADNPDAVVDLLAEHLP